MDNKDSLAQKESLRVESLKQLQIMDTPPEERFDYLTRVAKALFNAPIAIISFVDGERQWFKSCQGLSFSETKLEESFCYHVVQEEKVLIVTNARNDERFKDSSLVSGEESILFYAGVPLHDPEGEVIGSFAIKDRIARTLSNDELILLKELARTAEIEFNNQYNTLSATEEPEEATTGATQTQLLIDNFFALRRLKPLQMLSDNELMLIARVAKSQSFPPNHLIADNTAPLNKLYLLVDGSYVSDTGMELHPVVGIVSLLFNKPPAYPIHTGPEGAKCILLLKAQYFTLINACPKLMRSFIEMISFRNQ